MRTRVAVVGSINQDLVVETAALPAPGETVIGSELVRFAGGKGANQAVAAARMGAAVAFVGRVGGDHSAAWLLDGLRRDGIDVARVSRDDGASGTALITVAADGGNTIVVAPGANWRLSIDDVEAARSAIESSDALLLQLEVPLDATRRAAEIARASGSTVFLNPSPAAPLADALLALVDLLVLNQTELAILAGATAAGSALLTGGVSTVVVTLGAAGAECFTRAGTRTVPPFLTRAVDPTAAGDAFLGALAATAKELGLEHALDFASAAGALATTRLGAQSSLPTRAEVETLLRTGRGG